MGTPSVRFLVFDVETVADGALVSKLRYPEQSLEPREAIELYRKELLEQQNSDFIPYTFQIPVSVVIAKVSDDLRSKLVEKFAADLKPFIRNL